MKPQIVWRPWLLPALRLRRQPGVLEKTDFDVKRAQVFVPALRLLGFVT